MMTKVKTASEIDAMRDSGRMLATVLDVVGEAIKPGITTKELDKVAADELRRLGGKPSFLGYYDYPAVICISVNEEVVHGIPSSKVIKSGDIVSFDFGVTYKGMITDAARSVLVGPHNKAKQGLIDGTRQSLDAGMNILKDGVSVGDIAAAVQEVLDGYGFGIVRDLVGHGVGHALHEEPNIPNYGRKGTGPVLSAGMTIAIEPMATLGSYKVYTADDGWTVSTRDGSLAAHFENTVLITETGHEILTTV